MDIEKGQLQKESEALLPAPELSRACKQTTFRQALWRSIRIAILVALFWTFGKLSIQIKVID
jgi:hypothetical protein